MTETNFSQPKIDHLMILQKFFLGLRRLFVWLIFFAIIYLLRSFFLLIFLTFVFAYIQIRAVSRLGGLIRSRVLRVVLVALCFLSGLIGIGTYLVPSVIEQTKIFANNYTTYLQTVDQHLLQLSIDYPRIKNFIPIEWPEDQRVREPSWSPSTFFSEDLFHAIFGKQTETQKNDLMKVSVDTFKKFAQMVVTSISAFLLSLLFSFLIVLDLPRLTVAVLDLQNTKLKFFYQEVTESIFCFGSVLGQALEAQFFIAVLNTFFTAIGLLILGLKTKIAFLSMVVFICSFIPIVGVFISSIPICLLALQGGGGFGMMLWAILLIILIHMIETYVLNPRIYSYHLRINPVLVLILLTVAGKLFGMWGLVLAVPVCRYCFDQAIRYAKDS